MASTYWLAPRSQEVEHHYPYLVFDGQDHLHLPLTIFGKEVNHRLSKKTAQVYLYALLPFFTWLDTDVWQIRAGITWNASPRQIRHAVEDYLVSKLQCKVQSHHEAWKFVSITADTRSTIRGFLAALRLFYEIMAACEQYPFTNPLVESLSATIATVQSRLEHEDDIPRMPDHSGVVEPRRQTPKHRLSDNYFRLEHDGWQPQIVDSSEFPGLILKGGNKLSLKYTRQRDVVVTWLLFDTGARISEVTGLMLSDWADLDMRNKAKAFNKGSHGKRVKVLSFASETEVLLKRYFDEERMCFDPHGYTLDRYLAIAKAKQIDLHTVPLFLTTQGTQLTPKQYREHYWNPACQAIGIEADVHQARHWHVTRMVRDIYETAQNDADIQRRLHDLIEYMKWQSAETLSVYQHYFDQKRNDETRDAFHDHVHEETQRHLGEKNQLQRHYFPKLKQTDGLPSSANSLTDEPNLSFLYHLGGEM